MVGRLTSLAGGFEHDREVLLQLRLADELGKGARSMGLVALALEFVGGGHARLAHSPLASVASARLRSADASPSLGSVRSTWRISSAP